MSQWSQQLHSLCAESLAIEQQLASIRAVPEKQPFALLDGDSFIGANQACLDFFQLSWHQLSLHSLSTLSPGRQHSGVSSKDAARDAIYRAMDGDKVHMEWLLRDGDHEKPTRLTLWPCILKQHPVILLVITPIERRRQQRDPIEHGFKQLPPDVLSSVLEHSEEAIYITGEDNRILAANMAMSRTCGYSCEQLIGQQPDFLNADSYTSDVEQEFQQALAARGSWQGELQKKRADGSIYPVQLSTSRIDSLDGRIYLITRFSDISARKQQQQRLTEQAMSDALTGLPNRYQLTKLLNQALERHRQDPSKFGALMFMDLNGFKNINDSFGHGVGDRVLQLVAARLEAHCIGEAEIARLGGDEFTLLLEDCRDHKQVETVAREVLGLFDVPFELEGQKFFLGTSIGIALFPEHSDQAAQLISLADTAMYSAKKHRSHIQFYSADMQQEAERKIKFINNLRHAMGLRQFSLAYQGIVDLDTGHVIAAEALLRWQKDEHTLLDARDFLPQLEETGMIVKVGQWVLEQACRQAAKWRETSGKPLNISVNISPLQLEHPDFVDMVSHALAKANLPAESLILEITESTLLRQPLQAKGVLVQLREMGVHIAIDDFGTGLSSLSRLGSLPIDSLKIDAEFAQQLGDPQGQKLFAAVVQLARALDIIYIAEGVESHEQQSLLQTMGGGYGQGYLFGEPMDAGAFSSRFLHS
ncbi:EAL domain-containing protein [Shewanella corallii]|uniref:EAL domain-containing protein n=1 Tax=Shewanella corallii TaxID=560080 RepID=A0ABT0NAV2_9GAMM|nr:EAL domain-containing protein [Shewanella corallii]MCL2915265.1 EAL domain-containing protein [Shewanella corallii]